MLKMTDMLELSDKDFVFNNPLNTLEMKNHKVLARK